MTLRHGKRLTSIRKDGSIRKNSRVMFRKCVQWERFTFVLRFR